jgi:hypothetical protein
MKADKYYFEKSESAIDAQNRELTDSLLIHA